jgi:drug/metabolite transporter (DMT)-like permease
MGPGLPDPPVSYAALRVSGKCGYGHDSASAVMGPQPGETPASRPFLLAIVGAGIISCSAILVTLAGTGGATTTFFRCALALPALGALAARERRRLGPRQRRARLAAAGSGLLLGTDLVLWNHAIAEVGAGVATVLGNLQVLFVAAAAWALLGERPRRAYLAALPVVLAGVVLVSGLADHGPAGARALPGIGYGVASSITYAGFLLIFRQSSAGPAPGTAFISGPLFDATAGSAAAAVVLGLVFGGLSFAPPWPALGWLALLSVSSQTIGWLLITSSLRRLPAAVASLLLLLQPAGSLVLAAVILGEQPTLLQVAGAVLVCGGIVAANGVVPWLRRRPVPAVTP